MKRVKKSIFLDFVILLPWGHFASISGPFCVCYGYGWWCVKNFRSCAFKIWLKLLLIISKAMSWDELKAPLRGRSEKKTLHNSHALNSRNFSVLKTRILRFCARHWFFEYYKHMVKIWRKGMTISLVWNFENLTNLWKGTKMSRISFF